MNEPISQSWYSQSVASAIKVLDTRSHGLTEAEADERRKKYGANKLPEKKSDSWLTIFARQFKSPLIYILLASAAAIYVMGEVIDGSIILAILLFNAIVGATQEGKAQNTLLALKRFVETDAVVLRGGQETIVPDSGVTVGDIIVLREGEKIPADARIIASNNLKLEEAAITGESEPVHKNPNKLTAKDLGVADQKNMVLKGTNIVSGNGLAAVVAVGAGTYIGKIAQEISSSETEMPLKANIRYLSRVIIIVVGVMCAGLFTLGVFLGNAPREMFATVVSIAVSVIPEGLPIVMTLVLATGVWRMSRRQVLVKKLPAVEALGQAKIIAVDKTGTITKNELVVRQVFSGNKLYDIGGVGYEPQGDVLLGGKAISRTQREELLKLGRLSAFCASAKAEEEDSWRVAGDPTEAAILV